MSTVNYVAGFLFSPEFKEVVLIEKNKPAWQKGLYNGIGGKIEPLETPVQAMQREFEEEAGLTVFDWVEFCTIQGEGYSVKFFYSVSEYFEEVYSITDETVEIFSLPLKHQPVIENLRWLIPLAIDKANKFSGEIYLTA